MQEGRKAGRTIGYYQWLVLFMISTQWEREEDNKEWREPIHASTHVRCAFLAAHNLVVCTIDNYVCDLRYERGLGPLLSLSLYFLTKLSDSEFLKKRNEIINFYLKYYRNIFCSFTDGNDIAANG